MRRQVRLHPVRAFIAHREQQGGGLPETKRLICSFMHTLFFSSGVLASSANRRVEGSALMTGNHPKRWGRVSSPHRPVQSLCVVTTGSAPRIFATWWVSSLAPPMCPESTEMANLPVLSTQTTAGRYICSSRKERWCGHRFPWRQ